MGAADFPPFVFALPWIYKQARHMNVNDREFYASLPVFSNFADAVRLESYRPLPDDWVAGFSDVVDSTKAVAEGRYKAVNMVGAGVIAAVANALGRRPFPFVFGGDGASFAAAASDAPAAADALAGMAAFSREEFQLDLRVAMVPMREIRANGRDVKVARYAASEHCVYAMFAGGGLSWLEERAKRGDYALPPAQPDARPDLSGLSCRWGVAPARHGLVLSAIVAPSGEDPRFSLLVEDIVKMTLGAAQGGRPIDVDMLGVKAPGQAIALEAAAMRASGASNARARLTTTASYALGFTFLLGVLFPRFKLKLGGFDAARYAADVVANADFRKFDDGLRMTIDCTPAFADALEARLIAADEFANWGLCRQKSAQLTCLVPSVHERDHLHFVDGAEGGYAMAATALKARRFLKSSQAA